MSNFQLGIQLFLQLTVILVTCRLLGWFGKRYLGQTQVVMEMVAGVVLGPSLLGWLAPNLQGFLFPKQLAVAAASGTVMVQHPNMSVLYALAQIGLVLYMFLIGMEYDVGLLKGKMKNAALVSGAGILVPFVMAALISPAALARGDLFSAKANLPLVILFLGSAISITAFPMLARILFERGLTNTRMGALTLAAGSIDDALAWCLLAVVLSIFNKTPGTAWLTILGGLAYGLLMLTVARRGLAGFARHFEREGKITPGAYTGILLVVMVGAYYTDLIGIYAVFGAFVAGAAMPKGKFAKAVTEKTEFVTVNLLLPMFFVYSGLNTKIGLVNTSDLWRFTALVIGLSILGKGVACAVASRMAGEDWLTSWKIGSLMNSRGLMELILLNIGLDHGVVTPTLFTILVLMAVVTTVMASPIYGWLSRNDGPLVVPEEGADPVKV